MALKTNLTTIVLAGLLVSGGAVADVKTAADRNALFEDLVAKTMAREAFSPIKNRAYTVSYPEAFEPLRQNFISAQTDEDLYYAIVRFSNARNDRHLSVSPVDGGLKVNMSYNGINPAAYPGFDIQTSKALIVPIRLMADFGADKPSLFVSALAQLQKSDQGHGTLKNADLPDTLGTEKVSVGHRVIRINGKPVADYLKSIRPYHRASTEAGFLMRAAMDITAKSTTLPVSFYRDELTLDLKPNDGDPYNVKLPYLPREILSFPEPQDRYPGFRRVMDKVSFDLYRPTDDRTVLIFDWYGFRSDLVEAMDAAMDYASKEGLLDYDIIWDGTRSRGGGRGAYAVQRLQAKPFKTTFGNLRLSDVTPLFIESRRNTYERKQVMSDGSPETIDDGTWLMDWLLDDVTKGLAAGQAYSNTVPFKLAHAPKYSDGIIYPAKRHFTGRMICWLSPRGGSHLDQFAAIVVDNDLCTVLGMPAGGYSNTWEWEETLTWPGTDEPIVTFMWSIGHTVRPNGQILEGNPAQVDEYIPITADNYTQYDMILLRRSLEILDRKSNGTRI